MKKREFLFFPFLLLVGMTSCSIFDSPEEQKPIVEIDNENNMTSVSNDGLTIKVNSASADGITYDSVRKEFLILNTIDQAEYWVSGTSSSRIRFSPSCKETAVVILDGVNITTDSGSSPILWESDLKKLELKAQKGTENFLTATKNDVPAIESINNLDIGGGGVLTLSSTNASTVVCDKCTLKGTGTFNITSEGKHGIKCKSFEAKEKTTYCCNINASKCGIKADGDVLKEKGYVNLLSGTVRINSYGTFGISATSYLSIGGEDNYGYLTITSKDETTALDITGKKTKDPNGSSYKLNGVEKSF